MNRILFFTALLLVTRFASACPQSKVDGCKMWEIALKRIDLTNMNIANLETTRTPNGGPFQKRKLECKGQKCVVKTMSRSPVMKYEPDHVDANEDGYVAYPNISLLTETAELQKFTRDYEFAEKLCVAQSNR